MGGLARNPYPSVAMLISSAHLAETFGCHHLARMLLLLVGGRRSPRTNLLGELLPAHQPAAIALFGVAAAVPKTVDHGYCMSTLAADAATGQLEWTAG